MRAVYFPAYHSAPTQEVYDMTRRRKAEITWQRVIARRPRENRDQTDVLIARLTCGAIVVILFIIALTGGGGF
jgi:hypothetical protein